MPREEDPQIEVSKFYQTIRELQQDINALDNVVKKPQFNVLIDLHKFSLY